MTIELEHGKGVFYYYYAALWLFEKRGNILACSNSIVILFNEPKAIVNEVRK